MLHLFHRHVLHINPGRLPDAVRAKRPKRVSGDFTRAEASRVIGLLRGDT